MNSILFDPRFANRLLILILVPFFATLQSCQPKEKKHLLKVLLSPNDLVRPLNETETALLDPIKKIYPDFHFPLHAWVGEDTVQVRLVFPAPPLALRPVKSYNVQIRAGEPLVFYDFDCREGIRGAGVFMVNTEHVGLTETHCDSFECVTNFWGDGNLWDTRTTENEHQAYELLDFQDSDLRNSDSLSIARIFQTRFGK